MSIVPEHSEPQDFGTSPPAPSPEQTERAREAAKQISQHDYTHDTRPSLEIMTEYIAAAMSEHAAEQQREIEMYKGLYESALGCVDRVFQDDSAKPPPLLPNFASLGDNKFQAVIRLAEAYLEQQREIERLKAEVEQVRATSAVFRDGARKCVQRITNQRAEIKRLVEQLKSHQEHSVSLNAVARSEMDRAESLQAEVDRLQAEFAAQRAEIRRYVEANGFKWQDDSSTAFNATTAIGWMGGTIESLQAEVKRLREALSALVTQIDVVTDSPDWQSVWVLNKVRNGDYRGPNYGIELDAARAALAQTAIKENQ